MCKIRKVGLILDCEEITIGGFILSPIRSREFEASIYLFFFFVGLCVWFFWSEHPL